ncbi:hypothetical protein I4U23_019842 [Adineta vaga]|nr:hypothetical protein I4U23_019842 [Adineta vaga]
MSYSKRYRSISSRFRQSLPDINILILGETGCGKSTFINAFANYLIYNTLEDAVRGEMKVLIPSSFSVTDPDSWDQESTMICVGDQSDNEKCDEIGQSSTQLCRSYTFQLENRILRLIDTPGIGDVRGIEQDAINCDHVLNYLNRYEHLNGICMLFKPNIERLTVSFRFCFNQLLSQLNLSAIDNLMFVFTNGRAVFYQLGSTADLVKTLIKELKETRNVTVPFDRRINAFVFDNEAFRFLAMKKKGASISEDVTSSYNASWEKSVKEVIRLLERISQCGQHAVRDTLSINAARQLIHQLTRPIGEIARLIQENIDLAEKAKRNIMRKSLSFIPKQISQKAGKIRHLDHPRTVCTAENKCTEIITVDGEKKMNYKSYCHPHCYLHDVEINCIGHSILRYCAAISRRTGICKQCGCKWDKHMHITYEYDTYNMNFNIDNSSSRSALADIDRRLSALRQEQEAILKVCSQFALYVRRNCVIAYNNDITEYIRYFIREEEQKRSAGADNERVILGLKKMIEDFEKEKKILDDASSNAASYSIQDFSGPEDIFAFAAKLYKLPINGPSIRDQVEQVKEQQLKVLQQKEYPMDIPNFTNTPVMKCINEMNSSQ